MKICIGVTRRAHWKPLEETFSVISMDAQNKRSVHLGGWDADGKKYRIELDLDEVAKIADLHRSLEARK